MEPISYSAAVGETDSYLEVTLDLAEPVEIGDFAAFFAGLGSQFEDFLAQNHPDQKGEARLYVKEVREGSIVADLVPLVQTILGAMDGVLIIREFSRMFSLRFLAWADGKEVEDASKSGMAHMAETIRAIANDPTGSATLESVTYSEGKSTRKVELKFTSNEARRAARTIEGQVRVLSERDHVEHERKLMRFTRPDIGDAELGKRSSELVVIEELSNKPLPLIYGAALAEQRLKDETRDPNSVFYKGFVVDVNVQRSGGRPVAYSVTHVHQVIDLPKPD